LVICHWSFAIGEDVNNSVISKERSD